MKRYAISFFSFHENVLEMDIITAPSFEDALRQLGEISEQFTEATNLEAARQEAFDNDGAVDMIEI